MLNTITLILVILTLGFGVFTFVKTQSLQKELKTTITTLEIFREALTAVAKKVQDIDAKQKDQSAPKIEQSYFDTKTNTLVVKGNLKAEGWVSAGKEEK